MHIDSLLALARPAGARRGLTALFLFACVFCGGVGADAKPAPRPLSHAEAVRLYNDETPPAALAAKLRALLTTPFVSNGARGARPLKPSSPQLGRFLRVAFWNVGRGIELPLIRLAFTDPAGFAAKLDAKRFPPGSEERKQVLEQAEVLRQADVIVLNEADWGLKRSGYRHVAEELARATGMNYAFGVEFVEVDPISTGTEKFEEMKPEERREVLDIIRVEPSRFRGLHGNAILSRYPLENVRLIPFKHQGHDWYEDEKEGVSKLEGLKRDVGNEILLSKVRREVRRGGRMMLLAEIADADIPGGRATIVATHLENRAEPSERREQLEELLSNIKAINHPVILAGDMNTSGSDLSPTSVKNEITKRLGSPRFWGKVALKSVTGIGLLDIFAVKTVRSRLVGADPTVRSIPLIAPNKEAEFFEDLKEFRFADGGAFDFRGEAARSTGGKSDTFSNSNERADKGFVATNQVEGIGGISVGSKLDWIFVKPPALTDPGDEKQPHRFAPHFGRTLAELNNAPPDGISDHHPLTADLPFSEPPPPAPAPAGVN
ncbi:MAG: endonuclease/exonuclease/phosphatase family protein [Acidobacteriota bacterium]|nr:endonuclease/exonuclease/phosphatase family protein [Acidobacteriota bacterium]